MRAAAAIRGKLECILEARRRETRASRTTVRLDVPAVGFYEVWLTPTDVFRMATRGGAKAAEFDALSPLVRAFCVGLARAPHHVHRYVEPLS